MKMTMTKLHYTVVVMTEEKKRRNSSKRNSSKETVGTIGSIGI